MAALATHTYDFPSDATMQQAAALAQQYNKPLWATGICCMEYNGASASPSYGEQFDPTITGGLSMAQIIYEDLTSGNVSAFDWWLALSAAEGCHPAHAGCMTTVNSPARFSLQFPGIAGLCAAGTYQTSATASLTGVANPPVSGTTATLTTPAQSITTFLLGQSR